MPKPYHHGDLRRALLHAAWELLEEDGLDAVTLRAVARRAGVSHAAPGYHFRSKAGLVEAMVAQGYLRFAADLEQTWQEAMRTHDGRDPLHALEHVGLSYVRFARARPHAFALLNRPELRRPREDIFAGEVEEAAESAYLVLERAVVACQDAGQIEAGPPQPWALLAWTGVHGLAIMLTEGLLDPRRVAFEEEELARMLLGALRHGLQTRPT